MSESGTYQQDGGVVTLTLNEPDTRNALSPAIADQSGHVRQLCHSDRSG
jgi:enoyl-CoA hydratase/carnithine racemase